MPKATKYPKLRRHIRKRADGSVRVYYTYDLRGTGEPDINLGHDHAEALRLWDEIHNKRPRIKGTLEEGFQAWEKDVLPNIENTGTRRNYALCLKRLREFKVGAATWDGVALSDLKGYLKKRSAKRQANHEMSVLSLIWNWCKGEGITNLPWPAAGMQRSKWKNKEHARRYKVTDQVFEAIFAAGEPMLKDCMDLSSATSMRLTDCRTVGLPPGDILNVKASKTGKESDFDVSLSKVLPDLIARRRALAKAPHTMLLSMPNGQPVTAAKLRGAYDRAREKAAKAAEDAGDKVLADAIRAIWLRDCRKYAAKMTGSLEEAQKLLDHDDKATTAKHYFFEPNRKRPAR